MISRRRFIQLSGMTAAGMILPKSIMGATCGQTTPDVMGLGPYWEPDSPYRSVLASQFELGTRLFINGVVTANDCQTPISNVVIDAWQANDAGCYSVFQTCDTGNPDNDELNLRGRVLSDHEGKFSIETIKPGFYYLGNDRYRPSHIHFMITPPAGNTVVTQLYFEGDEYLDEDSGSSDPNAVDRIIPLVETENGLEGIFKIILDVHPDKKAVNTNIPTGENENRFQKVSMFPNPFNSRVEVRFGMRESTKVLISIYDLNGTWVRTLLNKNLNIGNHSIIWDGKRSNGQFVPAGEYFLSIQSPFETKMEKITYLK